VTQDKAPRPRARDLGIAAGVLDPGPRNGITDVAGVSVGHVTLVEGDDIRTGVTAIRPHGGNLWRDRVPAGFAVGNGFGKFAGSTQIAELGELEAPVILTNTLSVAAAVAGSIDWTVAAEGNAQLRSVNAVVGETNDGYLNDIRACRVTREDVVRAIERATEDHVAEGNVGAGTGTQAFGWKGGIGTSSRRLAAKAGGWTVGVLVQTNYDGLLTMAGVPVGRLLGGKHRSGAAPTAATDGSVVVVIATDAPLSDRNLARLARRAFVGIARTGSWLANGSGDYALAFSTAPGARRTPERRRGVALVEELANEAMSPLFQATAEATEEAVCNALLQAVTMTGRSGHRLEALPLDPLREILARHGVTPSVR
jgi:D-aminopeptidase